MPKGVASAAAAPAAKPAVPKATHQRKRMTQLVGRDGKSHAYAVDLNTDAARARANGARNVLVKDFVSGIIDAGAQRHAQIEAELRRAEMRELYEISSPQRQQPRGGTVAQTRQRVLNSRQQRRVVKARDEAAGNELARCKASHTPGAAKQYQHAVADIRGRYPGRDATGARREPTANRGPTAATPDPAPPTHHRGALPPLAEVRRAKGGAIPLAPRRTIFDDAAEPLSASAQTPTPGPAMLPYLEILDATRDLNDRSQRTASKWHRVPGRNMVHRAEVGCRPVYMPPMDQRRVKGGAIGLALRQ